MSKPTTSVILETVHKLTIVIITTTVLYCVSKKVYNPMTNDNFNSSYPIPVIFGTLPWEILGT